MPCFFSAERRDKAAVPAGWRSLVVADDTIVDLPGLEFTGKRWNAVRTSLNRAAREGLTFRMTRLADEPWGIRQQLRAISEMWVGDKGLPEMGFTLAPSIRPKTPRCDSRWPSHPRGRRRLPVVAADLRRGRRRCAAGPSTSCAAATAASAP